MMCLMGQICTISIAEVSDPSLYLFLPCMGMGVDILFSLNMSP